DGIRDKLVTGVQTCALPIYRSEALAFLAGQVVPWQLDCVNPQSAAPQGASHRLEVHRVATRVRETNQGCGGSPVAVREWLEQPEIGRASCRERVKIAVGAEP